MVPILVNEDMEVIDGQHRLLAAKMLGLAIYYKINKELTAQDIIRMNVSQPWGRVDYLNYYCKNNYPHYLKLKSFMGAHGINLKIALNITIGNAKDGHVKFRNGEYVFNEENFENSIEICWETINYIKKINGYSKYTESARFWGALLILVRDIHFNAARWRENLKRMVERITAKASKEDYLKLFTEIHNWRSASKVDLT
jgi:hypothetical protein